MANDRASIRRRFRTRFVLPGTLLAVATLGGLAMFFPGSSAEGSTTTTTSTTIATATSTTAASTTSTTTASVQPTALSTLLNGLSATSTKSSSNNSCGKINTRGVSPTQNSGDPYKSSKLSCQDGSLKSYGDSAISYSNPPAGYVTAGKLLFDQTCSSCHGTDANGVSPNGSATIGPNLQGVGAATVDFWVSTGRMPATDVKAVEAERKESRLTDKQALELAAYVNSLDPSVPAVPTPNVKAASVSTGASLFALNCAACHTITGAGDALANGTNAPSLQNRSVTPQQVAEAIRCRPPGSPTSWPT
jgi:mono/diheme cytochrome c family protein